jgi:hypothetical protein
MAENKDNAQPGSDVTSGKGRKDEVGRTGIYPASDVNAPADAPAVAPGELGHRSPSEELAVAKDVELAEPVRREDDIEKSH